MDGRQVSSLKAIMPRRVKTTALRRARVSLIIFLSALFFDAPRVQAADASANPTLLTEQIAELKGLQALDQRVADIGWRLATSNLQLCAVKFAATGITLHTASQYSVPYRLAAEQAFDLSREGPGVLSVAQGSPAWAAGIRPGDTLISVNGLAFAYHALNAPGQATYTETDTAMRRLESFGTGQSLSFRVLRGGSLSLVMFTPVPACASRFEMVTSPEFNADSNGKVVQVFGRLVVSLPDDNELALVMAHELAHNILGHNQAIHAQKLPTGLGALFGSSGKKVRDFERAADRYAIFMSARAGFDYRNAPQFWRRLAATAGLDAWIATTHPTPANREKSAQAAVAEVEHLKELGLPLVPSNKNAAQ